MPWPKFRIGDIVIVAHNVGMMSPDLMGFQGTVTEIENPDGVQVQWNYDVDGRYLNEQMLEMVKPLLPLGWPQTCRFRYERDGLGLGFLSRNMTNHELREIMCGFWLRLDKADRLDFIQQLQHYYKDDSQVSTVAKMIKESDFEKD